MVELDKGDEDEEMEELDKNTDKIMEADHCVALMTNPKNTKQ